MTNPFSPDYKPQLDTADLRKSSASSRHASRSRAKRLESDDPLVRMAARGTIPGLDTDPMNEIQRIKIIQKPSKL